MCFRSAPAVRVRPHQKHRLPESKPRYLSTFRIVAVTALRCSRLCSCPRGAHAPLPASCGTAALDTLCATSHAPDAPAESYETDGDDDDRSARCFNGAEGVGHDLDPGPGAIAARARHPGTVAPDAPGICIHAVCTAGRPPGRR